MLKTNYTDSVTGLTIANAILIIQSVSILYDILGSQRKISANIAVYAVVPAGDIQPVNVWIWTPEMDYTYAMNSVPNDVASIAAAAYTILQTQYGGDLI